MQICNDMMRLASFLLGTGPLAIIRAGTARALAVSSEQRLANFVPGSGSNGASTEGPETTLNPNTAITGVEMPR